jgi:hypothetical protein
VAGDRRPLKVPLLHSPCAISQGSASRVERLQMEAEGHPSSMKKPHRETRGADTKSQTRTLARSRTFAGRSETAVNAAGLVGLAGVAPRIFSTY